VNLLSVYFKLQEENTTKLILSF